VRAIFVRSALVEEINRGCCVVVRDVRTTRRRSRSTPGWVLRRRSGRPVRSPSAWS